MIRDIEEADFGCEERMPGEPLMVLVTLESEDRQVIQFEVADSWLLMQGLEEGDEWPDDFEAQMENEKSRSKQAQWMEGYLQAVEAYRVE